jgi:hypothetical protein
VRASRHPLIKYRQSDFSEWRVFRVHLFRSPFNGTEKLLVEAVTANRLAAAIGTDNSPGAKADARFVAVLDLNRSAYATAHRPNETQDQRPRQSQRMFACFNC